MELYASSSLLIGNLILAHALAAVAAGAAFMLAEKGINEQSVWRRRLYGIVAVAFFLMGLLIYQPAAMFFCVFAAIVLLKSDISWPSFLQRLRWHGAIMSIGLLLGFGVSKWGAAAYKDELFGPPRARLTGDISSKMSWFVQEPLLCTLNFMNLFPRWWISVGMAFFIIGGVMLYFHGAIKERLWKVLMCCFLIPISYLPNLVAAENWAAYRTQSALAALVAVYVFFALWGYGRTVTRSRSILTVTTVLCVIAWISVLWARHNVKTYFAHPQVLELAWLHHQLVQVDFSHIKSISIIRSRGEDLLAPASRYDEFGFPSSAAAWVPKPMVYLLLREMQPQWADLPIETVSPNGPFSPPANALVIDMRNIATARSGLRQ
ncbi:MAG: hypothetical protein FJ147_17855 [Deltaproteobacteria bacterium]|nr:hypothetical protein [Deltaproteobacteria bacterium]